MVLPARGGFRNPRTLILLAFSTLLGVWPMFVSVGIQQKKQQDYDDFTLLQVTREANRKTSKWPISEEVPVGFWDEGWRSIDFFQGQRKEHPHEATTFFGEGQEQAVVALFDKKRRGTFLDLASHNAVHLSNTYALERQFGWTGICIEANEANLADLASMRTCQVVMAVAGSTRMEPVEFSMGKGAGGMGGIVATGMDNTKAHNRGGIKKFYTVPLLEILERYDAPNVLDFFSLDVEGAEYYIMEHFPFEKYKFKVMTVERPKEELMELFESVGYQIIKKVRHDVLYVHESFLGQMNFTAIGVQGPYENQKETKWQLVPPVTTDSRFAITK